MMRKSAAWIVLALLSAWVLFDRLEFSFDLTAFFPNQTSLSEEVLLEQFRNGPGSRLLVIGLNGAADGELAKASDRLRDSLSGSELFLNVSNGELDLESGTVPQPLDLYYLLLSDIDYGLHSLQQAFENRTRDLAMGGGKALIELIARDPFLATLDLARKLAPADINNEMWVAADGSVVLMAETRASAVDLEGQAVAIEAVREAFDSLSKPPGLTLEMTGVGVFGVELQSLIRSEAQTRSLLASLALALVIGFFYRNLRMLLLAVLPLAMGFLLGLAALALAFDKVHGITLAFGFTLLGITIDYPLHLFSHAKTSSRQAIHAIWPTLRIGALSTVVVYLGLVFAGSEGLAQLGLFSATGVTTALLVTRFWLPGLLPPAGDQAEAGRSDRAEEAIAFRANYGPAAISLVVAVAFCAFSWSGSPWNDDISSLSPVPDSRIATDTGLRAAAGTADMSHQLVLHADSLPRLLQDGEQLDRLLQSAADSGAIESWQSVSILLPSPATFSARQNSIPSTSILNQRVVEAAEGTPFRSDAFSPFVESTERARTLPPLTPDHYRDTALASWLGSHLLQVRDQWVALVSLRGLNQELLRKEFAQWDGFDQRLEWVDVRKSSITLMENYRLGALQVLSVASVIVIAILLFGYRRFRSVPWVMLSVLSALAVTVAGANLGQGAMTVIHLVALLLVLGLGLDYALFMSRSENPAERSASAQAVIACAISTTLTFGILATSSIPLLRFLGLTVALGSTASFLIAWSGSRGFSARV